MIPFYYITLFFIEHEKVGSQKTLKYVYSVIIAIELSAALLVGTIGFYASIIGLTGLGIMTYNALYPFTNEAFPTEIKSTSFGFFTLTSALTGSFTPYWVF